MSGTVYSYTGYVLVQETEEFEYRKRWQANAGVITRVAQRRSVHTMTWEATLTDSVPEASSAYDHDQGYPGAQNPGNLDTNDGWQLYCVDYQRSLSTPMSKVVRETWVHNGNWTNISE